jgi:hypothetical protein
MASQILKISLHFLRILTPTDIMTLLQGRVPNYGAHSPHHLESFTYGHLLIDLLWTGKLRIVTVH